MDGLYKRYCPFETSEEGQNVPHKIEKLPVFGTSNDYPLLLLQLLLGAVLLCLDGIEDLLLLLLGDTLLRLLLGLLGLLILRLLIALVRLLLLVLILVLILILLLVVLVLLLLVLVLILILVLILVVIATAILLLVLQELLRVGVVVLGLHVRGIQQERVFIALQRLLEFLLLELGIAEVVEGHGTLLLGSQRIGHRTHQRLLRGLITLHLILGIAEL